MKKLRSYTSPFLAMQAAKLSRRSVLRASLGAATFSVSGPYYVKHALSSSGELNLLMWSDEFPDPVIPNFEKASGIRVNMTPFSQNEEQINKLQATDGEGFDLCQPTRSRAPQFKDLGVLAPFDLSKVKNLSMLIPSMLEGSQACGLGKVVSTISRIAGARKLSLGAQISTGPIRQLLAMGRSGKLQ
jgi:spermidine/putrescine transport system substrate-binding protein